MEFPGSSLVSCPQNIMGFAFSLAVFFHFSSSLVRLQVITYAVLAYTFGEQTEISLLTHCKEESCLLFFLCLPGLRHAVDADHIAAIDNTVRKLVAEGQRPITGKGEVSIMTIFSVFLLGSISWHACLHSFFVVVSVFFLVDKLACSSVWGIQRSL